MSERADLHSYSDDLLFTGERYVPDVAGDIELEHLHRYMVAREIVAGRTVVDVACGEGYGSAMLAESAAQVIGIDVSPAAAAHAAGKYRRRNLGYLAGDAAALPIADGVVDVFVSFETIEHHDRHHEMMCEIRRVLKPGGILVMSSPDRLEYSEIPGTQNSYHVKELYRDEFEALLRGAFAHVMLLGQRICYGSVIEGRAEAGLLTFGLGHRERRRSGLHRPLYWIAIASDELPPATPVSICETSVYLSDALREKAAALIVAESCLSEERGLGARVSDLLVARERDLALTRTRVEALEGGIARLERDLTAAQQDMATRELDLQSVQGALAAMYSSTSWRLTAPVRFFGKLLRGQWSEVHSSLGRLVGSKHSGPRGVSSEHVAEVLTSTTDQEVERSRKWTIVATRHTAFVAQAIASRLRIRGWPAEITYETPQAWNSAHYFILCPQMFNDLSPGERRLVFQMEQSVSSRWFTEDYLRQLETSSGVAEYSLTNVEFLCDRGIGFPHVYHLPLGAYLDYGNGVPDDGKTCDVLFYGDHMSCPRRREMLAALESRYAVRIVTETFGESMIREIKSARLVINLHYYENALLETTRIAECLSLGVPVVSESAADQHEYPEFEGGVFFFPEGSVPNMLDTIEAVLRELPSPQQILAAANRSASRFAKSFDRLLIGKGLLAVDAADSLADELRMDTGRIALSMPETIKRRRYLEGVLPRDTVIFDGVRATPGWVGCALSYRAIARRALAAGVDRLMVMEDDVVLPRDFEDRMGIIDNYLDATNEWDVFSGMIACLHEGVQVLNVEEFEGITFVTIDRMTSMVFNVYTRRGLQLVASWNSNWRDAERNTIDRYLERYKGLRIVVTLPFLAGHHGNSESTLWGFQNTTYDSMIRASEATLHDLCSQWKRSACAERNE